MPDYKITIYMRNGQTRTGIRWHTSYDQDWVKKIVEEKISKTIGMQAIKFIDVEIAPHLSGERMKTKGL